MSTTGVYGKLPVLGDFIQRNLPPVFVRQWDPWLQHFIAGARERIGDDWLETYLTSPIWRFALSPGVIEEGCWAGILFPSVDLVGRYFPFTIAMRLAEDRNPLAFLSAQTDWYAAIEDLGLQALNGELELDALENALAELTLVPEPHYRPGDMADTATAVQINLAADAHSASAAYPCMLDALLSRQLGSYSCWSTLGSERVAPCVFHVPGLPAVDLLPAMLDGHWQQWGWTQPYALQDEVITEVYDA